MAQRGNQILKPDRLNLDSAYELLKQNESPFLKNAISLINQGIGNAGANQNQGNLKPVVSNADSATFDLCIITYTWDMASTIAALPRNRLSIVVDGVTVNIPNTTWSTLQDIADSLNALGLGIFNIIGNNIIIVSAVNTFGIIQTDNTLLIFPPISVTPTTTSLCSDDGDNICIGSKYDRRLNQFFWFNWNSNSNHNFFVYDGNTNIATVIWIDQLFNFDLHHLITSIDIVIADVSTGSHNVQNIQRLVYWTDGFNPPRKMNVDVALAGGYAGLTFLRTPDEFMNRVKYPPLDIDITTTLPNPDPTFLYNFIGNKQFQFSARYNYQDGEYTTNGATSTLAYTTAPNKNFFELSISAGSSLVRTIDLYFRLGNIGDWKKFATLDRSLIITNTTYSYNNSTNLFIYQFFNDQAYIVVDQVDINRPYNYVPLKSGAEVYVEQNVLLDGDSLEGYDNLLKAELDKPVISVAYEEFEPLTLTITGSINFTFNSGTTIVFEIVKLDFDTGLTSIVGTYTWISGVDTSPQLLNTALTDVDYGDIIFAQVTSDGVGMPDTLGGGTFIGTYTHVPNPDSLNNGHFVAQEVTSQNIGATARVVFSIAIPIPPNTVSNWDTTLYQHVVPFTRSGGSQLKQGGVYEFAIIGYDAALRSTFIQPLTNGQVKIESIQQNGQSQGHTITVFWNGIVFPDSLYAIKLARTKNTVIDRSNGMGYLDVPIEFTFVAGSIGFIDYGGTVTAAPTADTKQIAFSLQNIINYNTANFNLTTTTYSFTPGDRVQFIRNGNGTYYTLATFGLIDVPLSDDPVSPGVVLRCEYNAGLSTLADGAWVELYTPAKQEQTNLYYEIGDFIILTGTKGNNTTPVPSTTVRTFDTYPLFWDLPYANNNVTDTHTTPFEHHSIYATKIVPSNGEDIGRINVINKNARQLWYPARIRKSLAYLPNTFVNGLSSNLESDYRDYNRANGAIQQMFADGFKVVVVQEDDVIIIQIAKNLVTLGDGTQQLVAAEQFFSNPYIVEGDRFGCQNSESFVEQGGMCWWVDVKRGAIVEFDWASVKDIARIANVKSYTEAKFKYLYNYNNDEFQLETCCYDVSEMPDLTTDDFIGVVVNGDYIYATNQSITTAAQLATYLTTLGYGTFTADGESVCIEGSENVFGDIVFYHPAQVYTYDFSAIVGSPFSEDLSTVDINGDIYESIDEFETLADFVAWLNTLGFGYFTIVLDTSVQVIDCENVYGDVELNDGGDVVIPDVTDSEEIRCDSFYVAPMVCNVDHFVLPAVYNPLQKQVLFTVHHTTTKSQYWWNIGTDFDTSSGVGVLITISIVVDSVVQSTSAFVEDIFNILAVINNLADDTATLIENDEIISIISSSKSTYGNIVIGTQTYTATASDIYDYINDDNSVALQRSETISWSLQKQAFDVFYSMCPEYWVLNDGNKDGLCYVAFRHGIPFFHNLDSVLTFDNFFGVQTNQIIAIVCNEGITTEKRYMALGLDSKDKTSSISSVKYDIVSIITSDNQESNLPKETFVFRENWLWSAFMRATNLGGNLVTGQGIRGTWCLIKMVRDDSESVISTYSEFAKAVVYFHSSEFTNK